MLILIILMNTEFRKYIKAVGTGPKLSRDLTLEEAERAFQLIMEGLASDAQIGGLLVPLRMKGETAQELAAFLKVTRRFCHLEKMPLEHFVDCGVAYDGKIKFPHLSVVGAFVAAGSDAAVLLHGQSNTPPKYGISVRDVFMELGVPVDHTVTETKHDLEEAGVGFLSVEEICPRFAELKKIREELGLRTVFNHIEKLWNPLNAPHQIVSIYHGPYLETVPEILIHCGVQHAWVVQGMEGTPDLRVSRPAKMVEVSGSEKKPFYVIPRELGFDFSAEPLYEKLTARQCADFVEESLRSENGILHALAVLNGALLIYSTRRAASLSEAVERARESLNSRRALNKLESLRKMARQF